MNDKIIPDDEKAGGLWYRRWFKAASALTEAQSEIARLREALEKICINSNTDWVKVSADPLGYIKRVHSLAVDAYYARRTHND